MENLRTTGTFMESEIRTIKGDIKIRGMLLKCGVIGKKKGKYR